MIPPLWFPLMPDPDQPVASVTVIRDKASGKEFLTVEIDREQAEVVNAYDEKGYPIALSVEEEDFAIRMMRLGYED